MATDTTQTKQYPEHEKLRAVHDKTLLLSEFYDWLTEQDYHIAKYHEHDGNCFEDDDLRRLVCGLTGGRLYDFGVPRPDELFGLFFDIDPKKLSDEKDAMVEEMRRAAATKEG